jgi:formate hydrogenlyase subunit 4
MTMMNTVLYILLQIIIIITVAPLVNGIIKKIKAFTQKRQGAPVLQMYYDLFKLFKKNIVISETSSWIFKATPYIVFSTALVAAIFVPATTFLTPTGFSGDIIMLVYILALGRFFIMLAGLDTGSTFGGMGSSREAMISSLIEPAILVSLFTIGLISKSTSVLQIIGTSTASGMPILQPSYILCFLSLVIVIIAETSRIPVDDPATHLELTMVHEAMILEYSGRHLALMEYAASIKQLVFITLVVNIFFPLDQLISTGNIAIAIAISLAAYILKIVLASVIIGIVETGTVKLRLFSVPNLAAMSFILAFIGFLQYFVVGR